MLIQERKDGIEFGDIGKWKGRKVSLLPRSSKVVTSPFAGKKWMEWSPAGIFPVSIPPYGNRAYPVWGGLITAFVVFATLFSFAAWGPTIQMQIMDRGRFPFLAVSLTDGLGLTCCCFLTSYEVRSFFFLTRLLFFSPSICLNLSFLFSLSYLFPFFCTPSSP